MVPDELLKYKGQPGFEYLDNFGNGTRRCYKCKEFKDAALFSRDAYVKDGLSRECRECNKERAKRYMQKNQERNSGKPKDKTYHKTCSKCGVTKSSAGFYRNRSVRDGLSAQCKDCDRKNTQTFLKNNPNHRKKHNERAKRKEAISRAVATVSGRYSPEEDLVVLDKTLTEYQKATKLSRTSISVRKRRVTLKMKGILTVEDLKKSLA